MRVLVCGSRDYKDVEKLWSWMDGFAWGVDQANPGARWTLVEGGARGADTIAGEWADRNPNYLIDHETYPADWERYGKAAGPIRNQQMLDTGIDKVIAFTHDLSQSRGTADMVLRARKAGVDVEVIEG